MENNKKRDFMQNLDTLKWEFEQKYYETADKMKKSDDKEVLLEQFKEYMRTRCEEAPPNQEENKREEVPKEKV